MVLSTLWHFSAMYLRWIMSSSESIMYTCTDVGVGKKIKGGGGYNAFVTSDFAINVEGLSCITNLCGHAA